MTGPADGVLTRASAATPSRDTGALHAEVCRLAWQVTEASQKLKDALRHKDRLSKLLDTVLESLEAGVVLLDERGRLLAANGASRKLGAVREAGAAVGLRLAGALSRFTEATQPAGETGELVRPDGLCTAWVVRPSEVVLPEGDRGRLLLIQDVTRLVELEERAHRRSRLELLGRMTAELAHEVRNPLGGLELFAAMLVDELDENSESRETAERILLGVRQLSGTVNRFLGTARGGAGPRRDVDVVGLVRETLRMLRPVAFSRDVSVVLDKPPAGRIDARLDAEGVRQALLNLLGNALDATPASGRVDVRLAADDESVTIEITDDGPGVPNELKQQIFEPFFSTREQGTGLGLAVVERVALAHDGGIEVHDAPGGGARFRLVLRRHAVEERCAEPGYAAAAPPAGGAKGART